MTHSKKLCVTILACLLVLSWLAACAPSYDSGYDSGYEDGHDDGYGSGYDEGYDVGCWRGREEGRDNLWDEIGDEYNFYYDHIALVTEAGEKYHHYDCYHIPNGTLVYIYTVETAERNGYTACLDCWDEPRIEE